MPNTIKFGNRKVISSGNFICFDNEPSIISFERETEKISLKLVFSPEQPKDKVEFNTEGSGDNLLITMTIPQIENSLGSGLTKPIKLANFDNGDPIYLHLWVRKLAIMQLEVIYTIYIGDIENGSN